MRGALTLLFRLVLSVFFRTVAADGLERLPRGGATVLVLNHPNGLLDPLVLLCRSPRPVSFLAKAPLFSMPLVSLAVKAFDSIPVHRRQDEGSDPARNRQTFEAARSLLARGGVLALFPEGVSHDEPRLMPLKTGAARIVLGAAGAGPIQIVPAGLAYTAKHLFRSDVLLTLGEPFEIQPESGGGAEPSAAEVEALTGRIRDGLAAVTLQADGQRALALSAAAARIFTAASGAAAQGRTVVDGSPAPEGLVPLAGQVAVQRAILARYGELRRRDPERLAALERRVERLTAFLDAAGLAPADVATGVRRPARLALSAAATLLGALLLLPLAAAGFVTHWPTYRLVGALARRIARRSVDVVSTVKVLAALVLYPLTWGAVAAAAYVKVEPAAALATAALPMCGLAALFFAERLEQIGRAARVLSLALFRRRSLGRLAREGQSLAGEMRRVEEELAAQASASSASSTTPATIATL